MLSNRHAFAARGPYRRSLTSLTRRALRFCASDPFRSHQTCISPAHHVPGYHSRVSCAASTFRGGAETEPQPAGPGTAGRNNELTNPPASGPPIKKLYAQVEEKALRDPSSLSTEEVSMLVNGLPRHYRHKHVPPKFVEEAFDGGMLTLHELARTLKIDLNIAVKQIGASGQLRKALRLTDYLVRSQKANQHTLAAFFQACKAVNRPTIAARVWEMWVPSGLIGPVSASAAINCVVSYDAEMGLAMLERMERLEVAVNQSSYHQIIKALSANRNFQAGVRLFESMKKDNKSLKPSAVTIQHMLHLVSCCRAWEYAEDIYRYTMQAGIIPDAQLAATFMKVFCDAMELHVAEIIFRSKLRKWNIQPDRYHYNVLLAAYAQQGNLESVQGLLWEMERDGVEPDEYTTVSALTAAARAPATALEDVEVALRLARQHGLQHNTYVCGALVQAYRNCIAVPPRKRQELGESVLRDMEAAGTPVNGVVVNSMLALYWETFEYRKARQQYDEMIEMGVMPNARTCQIMVQMCEEAGWFDEAESFRQLRETMPKLEGTRISMWNLSGEERVELDSENEGD